MLATIDKEERKTKKSGEKRKIDYWILSFVAFISNTYTLTYLLI